MKNADRAADDIKRIANMFKGLIDLSTELEQIGSIETHTAELKYQKDQLFTEVESLKSLTDSINKENDDKIAAANEKCEEKKLEAKQLIDEATEQANKIATEAKDKAGKFQESKTSELQEVYEKQKQAKAELKEIQKMIADDSEKLNQIKLQIEKLKGSF